MLEDNLSNCLKYSSGVVIALERQNFPPEKKLEVNSPITGLIEPALFYYSPGARLILRAYFVTPGEEARYLGIIAARPNVLATSLDFVGFEASSIATDPPPIESYGKPQWFLQEDRINPLSRDGIITTPIVSFEQNNQAVIAVVDPSIGHCKNVVKAAKEAYFTEKEASDPEPVILALCLEKFNSTALDLWSLSILVLSLFEVTVRISALNFSFDLGGMCGSRKNLPSPLGTGIYSFPLFESLLEELMLAFYRRGLDPPLLFAAAGNTHKGDIQWRLAYPAVLPNVVAVTQVEPYGIDQAILSQGIDIPAVAPLKPCFSEFYYPGRERGSSFACAALAGKWALYDTRLSIAQKKLGQFEKIAYLQYLSKRKNITHSPLSSIHQPWIPYPIRYVQYDAYKVDPPQCSFLKELLVTLRHHFNTREFLLTGSGAFLDAWITAYQGLSGFSLPQREVLQLIGDLDILYSGSELNNNEYPQVKKQMLSWLEKNGQKRNEEQIRLQLHSLKGWSVGLHLLQCVIPEACFFLTAAGPIAPWNQESPLLFNDQIQFFPPPSQAWECNPQVRGGSTGLAHALFIWLNLNLLRARLEKLCFGGQSIPNWILPDSLKEHYLLGPIVNCLLPENNSTINIEPWNMRNLFGNQPSPSGIDRFSPRLLRTLQLIGNEEGNFWDKARKLHELFRQAWQNFQQQTLATKIY